MTKTNLAATEKKYSIPKETKFKGDVHKLADHAMREDDRVIRWKMVHALLRQNNKKARREQDKVAKEAASVRADKIFSKHKSKKMGLRFGVALPPTTFNALVQADLLITGHSDLQHPDKEESMDLKSTNKIVKDLAAAFPQYKVS